MTELPKNPRSLDMPQHEAYKNMGTRCACFQVRKASRLLTAFYDQLFQPTGIRGTQFSILATLSQHPLNIQSLAQALVMDRTTVTRNISLLEKQGYIQHASVKGSKPDKRQKLWMLTPKGQQTFEQALPYWLQAQSTVETLFGAPEVAQLNAQLNRLVNQLSSHLQQLNP